MKLPVALATFFATWAREYMEVGKPTVQVLKEMLTHLPTFYTGTATGPDEDIVIGPAEDPEESIDLGMETPSFVLVLNTTTDVAYVWSTGLGAAKAFALTGENEGMVAANGITVTTGPAASVTLGSNIQAENDVLVYFILGK